MIPETLLALIVIIGVYFDLRERRIPNWITIPALGGGLVFHGLSGGIPGIPAALVGALAGAAILALPYALGWVGGGDLKLLAAVGALMGAPFALWTIVFASAAAGIMAVGWLAMTGSLANSLSYVFLLWRRRSTVKPAAVLTSLSFGPALAAGVLAAWLWQ